MKIPKICLLLIVLGTCCNKNTKAKIENKQFENTPVAYPVTSGDINEASGIAHSKMNPGYLWTEQDSGNPPEIILLTDSGKYVKRVFIKDAVNRDWEDMAIGNGPVDSINYLYLAETGDNKRRYADYCIYRFPEPSINTDTVINTDKIRFIYPDGKHDAEAILLDNNTRDLYIITKRDVLSRIYKISYPQNITGMNTAKYIGELPFSGIVGAAISEDNTEIILKSYFVLYHWKKKSNEPIESILKHNYTNPEYISEPAGEAICFANNNKGFFTLSERSKGTPLFLNFYKRK